MAFLLKMKDGVIGRCWHPGFGRISKPDFSLARATLKSRGFGKASRGVCCYSRVALLWFPKLEPWSDGAGWAENSTRAGTVTTPPEGLHRAPGPVSLSHPGRKGHCTRAAFHSKGITFPCQPSKSSPLLGEEDRYRTEPGWPEHPSS